MQVDALARFLVYVLGHRPDEFGLLPDAEGYVGLKELLKAIHEEPEWRHVRQGAVNEILMGRHRGLFALDGNRIRAVERHWQPPGSGPPSPVVPKTLYTAVRRRAHAVVMEKGLKPHQEPFLLLSEKREAALRIGRRRDPEPIVLEIRAAASTGKGGVYYAFESLFLSPAVRPEFIAGPPVAKEVLEERASRKEQKDSHRVPQADFSPGTFLLEPLGDAGSHRKKGKKGRGWKEDARRMRRQRERS